MTRLFITYFFLLLSIGCVPKEKSTEIVNSENPAALSVRKEGDGWNERHQTILGNVTSNPALILIGNSIFHSLDNENRHEVWEKYLNQYKTVNMGISGDRTENVIWRLENGSLENIHPKVALILIGTNNTDGNHYLNISTPEELAGGIWRICEIVNEKLPETKILLMGILPYGYTPNYRNNINKATNIYLSGFPEKDPNIHYLDIGHLYMDAEGQTKQDLMPDYLHPNVEGHMLMFETLKDDIEQWMD